MLRQEDLDAAVAKDIVTRAQALALADFVAERERARAGSLGHEERFRFMRTRLSGPLRSLNASSYATIMSNG